MHFFSLASPFPRCYGIRKDLVFPAVLLLALLSGRWIGLETRVPPANVAMAASAEKPSGTKPSTKAATGKSVASKLYRQQCMKCHGKDGTGAEARGEMSEIPDFTSRRWQERRSDAKLIVSILDGKNTKMPAFGGKLNEEQARDLLVYIRAFGPGRAAPVLDPPSDFEKRFLELQAEWQKLRKQFREASTSPP